MTLKTTDINPASWRDPAGFVFTRGGVFYRQVSQSYRHHYDLLTKSGLYDKLVSGGLLLAHEEVEPELATSGDAYRIIRPQQLEFISYPYEWSFGQLKAAALATLDIQRQALDLGMTLKDASAYNIQFLKSKPVLIDTLSFEKYEDSRPWIAYHQFCRHFLAPLALATLVDIRLLDLLRVHIDGIPLDLASKLLPRRSWLRFGLLTHLHLHAKSVRSFEKKDSDTSGKPVTKASQSALLDNLRQTISKLEWHHQQTEWGDYYQDNSYTEATFAHKLSVVEELIAEIKPKLVWDLGANSGAFSRLASAAGAYTVAWDIDPAAVESNYKQCRKDGDDCLLPLRLDFSNPSPGLGWAHRERMSLQERGPADLVLALALVHHLAIGNNVPLPMFAEWLASVGDVAIVEFVPKDDPQVKRLLVSREDIFADYNEEAFRSACEQHFTIETRVPLRESQRVIYHLRKKVD